jgi:hypothetical protein
MADAGATGPTIDVTPTAGKPAVDPYAYDATPEAISAGGKQVPWFLYGMILIALYLLFGEE